jgi:hypothetical protein
VNSPTESDRRTEDADELARAIRELPQAAAGPSFHAAVLSRAAGATTRRRFLRRRLVSLSAAVGIVAVGLGIWRVEAARVREERAERRAALVEEHRRLSGDLDEIRALAERRSSIRLGGDATTDLYIDLAPVAAQTPAGAGAADPSPTPTRSHS